MKAEGHVAKILRFDNETVLLPLSEAEARWLHSALVAKIKLLAATGDFPEEPRYQRLAYNLMSAIWMHTQP